MKCIAIDDEAMALNVMENYIAKVPFLTHCGSFTDALKAVDFLNKNDIDLLFLDINMPDITGVQLLKSLKKAPLVIFTTAYTNYAVESYEYEAVDYILKPIHFDRFLKAVNKAESKFTTSNVPAKPIEASTSNTILIKSGTSLFQIKLDEILYVEGTGNYVSFVMSTGKILSLLTMSEVLEILPSNQFSRIHKSFIVSHDKVKSIDRSSVSLSIGEIPLSATFREDFLKKMKME